LPVPPGRRRHRPLGLKVLGRPRRPARRRCRDKVHGHCHRDAQHQGCTGSGRRQSRDVAAAAVAHHAERPCEAAGADGGAAGGAAGGLPQVRNVVPCAGIGGAGVGTAPGLRPPRQPAGDRELDRRPASERIWRGVRRLVCDQGAGPVCGPPAALAHLCYQLGRRPLARRLALPGRCHGRAHPPAHQRWPRVVRRPGCRLAPGPDCPRCPRVPVKAL
ncbi:hypothetical protein GGI21_001088, partial [Coemansia aciculifera]